MDDYFWRCGITSADGLHECDRPYRHTGAHFDETHDEAFETEEQEDEHIG